MNYIYYIKYRKRQLINIIILVVLFTSFIQLEAQVIRSFGIRDGLANNTVWQISQDTLNRIWFATDGGICVYNGSSFKQYRQNINSEKNLPSNYCQAIICSNDGRIWVGSRSGLAYYDEKIDDFILVEDPNNESLNLDIINLNSLNNNSINISTYGTGAVDYSASTNTFNYLYSQSSNLNSLSSDYIKQIIQDTLRTWYSTFDSGISIRNHKNQMYIV